jgi:tripartite ATP-independent transporter DctP family solute receptor
MSTKRISRRTFAAASAATLASINFVRLPASAAQFSFKMGTDNSPQNPTNVLADGIFAEIKAKSGGRLEIKNYPNNQLGGASQMVAQVRSGALEFMMADGGVLGSVVPLAAIIGVGFAFDDSRQAFRALDGDLGNHVRKQIRAAGLFVHDKIFQNGMRQVTSSAKPITADGDLQGLKIRTPAAKLATDLFATLGASPTPMNFNEVYTALQTKIVDAQENPLTVVETAHLYEVQKYLSLTSHMWSGFWMIGNGDSWASLPPDLQRIASTCFDKFALQQRVAVEKMNASLQANLIKQGMAVNRPSPASFRAKLKPFYARWKNEFGADAWDQLEKYSGKLT